MNEEFELAKVTLQNATDIADIKSNPVVDSGLMSVVKAIPVIGDMLDSSTNKLIENFQKKKEQEFIDIVLKDKHSITSDMVNDVEFIVNYNRTLEVVHRLATNDKVRYFGNLIRNGYLSGGHIENSEFEEYLDVLNTMSYREIQYLVDYFKYCNGKHIKNREKFNIWYQFKQEYSSKMGIRSNKLFDAFSRISNTGFVQSFYVTEQSSVEGTRVSEIPAEQEGFLINNCFHKFYNTVLMLNEE